MTQVSEISRIKGELEQSSTVVLFGPQCSGKTTLAKELIDFEYVSLGAAVRSCENEELLAQANQLIEQAAPWPAELGLQFIAPSIEAAGDKVLIDGFPRKFDEYEVLRDWQSRNGLPEVDTFLEVTASYEVLLARYALRSVRGVENQSFFDLRYRQYKEFADDISRIAMKLIRYDTSDGGL